MKDTIVDFFTFAAFLDGFFKEVENRIHGFFILVSLPSLCLDICI